MRVITVVQLFLVGLCFSVQGQDNAPFTLDQVLSAPFPAGMTSCPKTGAVAWEMNDKGARNVWVALPEKYQGVKLTSWSRDDGSTISQLAWTPDCGSLLFVRGDGPNRGGELPNPIHLVGGVKQAIWKVDIEAGEPVELTEGTSPLPAPGGSGFAFLRRGQIWWLSFGKERAEDGQENDSKARQWIQARGSAGSLTFSPDGGKLAFASRRGDHSFIAVWERDGEKLTFLDPSVDRDSEPVFSPEGGRLAFLRIPNSTRRVIFTPVRQAIPFSIHVHDFSSGQTREVWRAGQGRGSAFRELDAARQLFWSFDDFLIFPWEAGGWTHLYAVPAAGGEARHLTPGDFEVENAVMSADGREMIYSSNQDDIDRRHLWKVQTRGGRPEALTQGSSNEWSPTPAAQGSIAFIRSTGKFPAQPAMRNPSGGQRLLAPSALPADFPSDDLTVPRQVIFSSADGQKIHGQLFLPTDHQEGQKHPAMLYFHGGSRRQMILGWHYSNYYHNCYAFNQYLAGRGFVVLSVNYRSGIGYGMEFREALNYGAAGASEFNDVLGAGIYLRGRDDVDPQHIGLWGGSYGGYLTALGLSRASHLFAAGVDLHGVHDWNEVIRNFLPSYDPLANPEAARLAVESSPMSSLDTWRSPVLLIHGDDDRNVPFSESVDLARELRLRGVEFEQLIFPDEVHGFLLYSSWHKAFEKAADFLQRKLGDAQRD